MVVILFAPGDSFEGYTVLRVLPSEGKIQNFLVASGDGTRLVLSCRIKRRASLEEREAFRKRAEARKELTHASLPPIDKAGYARDTFFWITEEAPSGRCLRDVMDKDPAGAGVNTYLLLLNDIALAMQAAIEQDFAHFRLTPRQIYVGEDDFDLDAVTGVGIRMVLDADLLAPTREEVVYRAPEQVRRLNADYRADIYAVGMILYELVAGEPPYADNLRDIGVTDIRRASDVVIDAMNLVDPTRLSEKVPGIEAAVEKLVIKMIQKNPTHRAATWEHVRAGVARAGVSFAAALVMAKSDALEGIEQTLAESGSPPIRELLGMLEEPSPESANDAEGSTLSASMPPSPSASPSLSPQSPSAPLEAAPGPTPPPSPPSAPSASPEAAPGPAQPPSSPPPAQPGPRRRARAAVVTLLALLGIVLGLGVSLILLPQAPECANPAPLAMLLGSLALPEPAASPPVMPAPSASPTPLPAPTLLPARTIGRARAPSSDVQPGPPGSDPCRDKYPDFWQCKRLRPKRQRRE